MIKVYTSAPFGLEFHSVQQLEDLIRDWAFEVFNEPSLSIETLRQTINQSAGLFYYTFIEVYSDKKNQQTFDKTIKRVRSDSTSGVLILPPEVPFYFVLYERFDASYFRLAEGYYSESIDHAIALANDIMRGDRVARILLHLNAPNSTIENVHIEYVDRQLILNPMTEEQMKNKKDDHVCFDPVSVDCLFLNPKLIDFSTTISPGQPGFKRLVLFLAITLVHESTHYKNHMYNPTRESPQSAIYATPEAGWFFEESLLDGVMDLEYDIEAPSDLRLILTSDVLHPLTFSSSRAGEIQGSLRNDQQVQIPNLTSIVPFVQDDIELEANIEDLLETTDDQPTVRFKIKLTNKSQRQVKLPVSVLPLYTLKLEACIVLNDGSKEKLYRRSYKPRMMQSYEASVLPIGESRVYSVNLSALYRFNYGSTYSINLQFQTRVAYDGVLYQFKSNPQSLEITFAESSSQSSKNTHEMMSQRAPLGPLCQNLNVLVVKKQDKECQNA